jgi:hypothetical protein
MHKHGLYSLPQKIRREQYNPLSGMATTPTGNTRESGIHGRILALKAIHRCQDWLAWVMTPAKLAKCGLDNPQKQLYTKLSLLN